MVAGPLDITAPLGDATPHFPGDPEVRVTPVKALERGDPYRLCSLAMGSHAGTHLDAPSHFLRDGATVETADLTLLNGPTWIVDVPHGTRSIGRTSVADVPGGMQRVLFRTSNSPRWVRGEPFFPDFVAVDPGGAAELLRRGVRLVGVDGLSVESDTTGQFPVHHALLAGGCWIVEGLRLAAARPGPAELRCLPLPLVGADGAPCRAVLWS
jgi:arylformamidase